MVCGQKQDILPRHPDQDPSLDQYDLCSCERLNTIARCQRNPASVLKYSTFAHQSSDNHAAVNLQKTRRRLSIKHSWADLEIKQQNSLSPSADSLPGLGSGNLKPVTDHLLQAQITKRTAGSLLQALTGNFDRVSTH